jgi:probable rRNA maturation factor
MAKPTRVDLSVADGIARSSLPRRAEFSRWVEAALAQAGAAGVVSLRIADEAEMRTLNARFRGQAKSTNVLSFGPQAPSSLGAVDEALLGDVVLCAPVVAVEARAQGKPVRDHYAHLCVHGVLHLLGYDHEDEAEAERMEAAEVAALARVGVADPYRPATEIDA